MKREVPINRIVILCLFVLCLIHQSSAQDEDSSAVTSRLFGSVSITESFNDNILDYSSKDLFRLNNGNDILNFYTYAIDTATTKKARNDFRRKKRLLTEQYQIDKSNDVITSVRLRIGVAREFFENNPTSLRLRVARSLYSNSPVRNYSSFGIEVRQAVFKKYYFSLGYSALPEYYLRNLYYEDYGDSSRIVDPRYRSMFLPASLSKNSYAFEVGGSLSSKFSFSVQYDLESAIYNHEFTERDNIAHVIAFDASYKFHRTLKFYLDYKYSDAIAEGSVNSDTNIADISNSSHRFNIGGEWNLKSLTKLPLHWKAIFVYEAQSYSSVKFADVYHYGRKDNFYKIFSEVEYLFLKNFIVSLNYSWEENNSNLVETSDAGSYQTHQVGLGIEYSFRF
ncbi:MAG: hypothetical protein HYZ34_03595 [Ignavibacteriae bacterium]|nr:hypothetical protein [Ignavibacteriota bacterium]